MPQVVPQGVPQGAPQGRADITSGAAKAGSRSPSSLGLAPGVILLTHERMIDTNEDVIDTNEDACFYTVILLVYFRVNIVCKK